MATGYVNNHGEEDIDYVLPAEVQVVERMKKNFLWRIDPSLMCPYLSCLTLPDKEAVIAKENQKGSTRATIVLLDKLVRRNNFWEKFLNALREDNIGLADVADKLEKDLEKFNAENPKQLEHLSQEDNTIDTAEAQAVSAAAAVKRKLESSCSESSSCELTSNGDIVNTGEVVDGPIKKFKINNCEVLELSKHTPRLYQEALSEPGCKGFNTVINAPTGSGKTMVASLICKSHLEQMYSSTEGGAENEPRSRILMIVPRFAVLLHVYKELKQALPLWRVGKRSGASTNKTPLNRMFDSNHVMVVTADIFKNAILLESEKCMAISDPTLIIFDECHYTSSNHSYNLIMMEYLKEKYDNPTKRLPQIIGLTASPGAGKKVGDDLAQERILKICANLDTQVFQTVPDHLREELEKYVSTPIKHLTIVSHRESNPFMDCITALMVKLEEKAGIPKSTVTVDRGTQEYQSLVVDVKTQAVEQGNDSVRKYSEHLMLYNNALTLVKLVRMIDGCKLLAEEYNKLSDRKEVEGLDSTELDILQQYKAVEEQLRKAAEQEDQYPNSKMLQLKQALLEFNKSNEKLRGIIFVKTKQLSKALKEWMDQDPELQEFSPEIFTGIHADADRGGMTQSQQDATVKRFEDGDTKLLISTSVGEEGINIPECNLVVRYNHVTNEIAMVQARGRARKSDALELVIGDLTVAEKDKINVLLEECMENAIKTVQAIDTETLSRKIKTIQLTELKERERKENEKNQLKMAHSAEDVQLKCRGGCNEIKCSASDMRVMGQNCYINPQPEFKHKFVVTDHSDEKLRVQGIRHVQCAKCKAPWGRLVEGYPCLALKGFICVIKGQGKTVKQWSKIPCTIQKFIETNRTETNEER